MSSVFFLRLFFDGFFSSLLNFRSLVWWLFMRSFLWAFRFILLIFILSLDWQIFMRSFLWAFRFILLIFILSLDWQIFMRSFLWAFRFILLIFIIGLSLSISCKNSFLFLSFAHYKKFQILLDFISISNLEEFEN